MGATCLFSLLHFLANEGTNWFRAINADLLGSDIVLVLPRQLNSAGQGLVRERLLEGGGRNKGLFIQKQPFLVLEVLKGLVRRELFLSGKIIRFVDSSF